MFARGILKPGLWLLAALPAGLLAQWAPDVQAVKPLRLRMTEENVECYVEGQDDRRVTDGDVNRRRYLLVENTLGFDLHGSVYHPNLLEFQLTPELGADWQTTRRTPGDEAGRAVHPLIRYVLRADILRRKPFAASFFAEQNRTYRDLDFFNRERADILRFGAHGGYVGGPLPFSVDALHTAEDVTGDSGRTNRRAENTLALHLSRAPRKGHKASVSYVLDAYHRTEGGMRTDGTSHDLTLLDSLTWGAQDRYSLYSTGRLNRLTSTNSRTQLLAWQEILNVPLRRDLSAEGFADFGAERADPVSNRTRNERITLRHQLYRSLTSTASLQESAASARGLGTRISDQRLGGAASLAYGKNLPHQSHLSITASWNHDRQHHRNAGQIQQILAERIVLSDRRPAFLAKPQVIAVARVTDAVGLSYLETLDYLLIRQGNLLEVRRVPGGNIPEGATVQVDYTAEAQPSDSYTTIGEYYYARLELFDRTLAVYARFNRVRNFGGESLLLRDLADRAVGVELTVRWLTVGADRDRQDSNIAPFRSRRVYQSMAVDLGSGLTFGVDAEQSRTVFTDTQLTRIGRNVIGRLQKQLAGSFELQLEGGRREERGQGIDLRQTVARGSCRWQYGKLLVTFSYDFQNETILGEQHRRHRFMLRAKRSF